VRERLREVADQPCPLRVGEHKEDALELGDDPDEQERKP
jgi:hypothetical protein